MDKIEVSIKEDGEKTILTCSVLVKDAFDEWITACMFQDIQSRIEEYRPLYNDEYLALNNGD